MDSATMVRHGQRKDGGAEERDRDRGPQMLVKGPWRLALWLVYSLGSRRH
jgi:hypothetical protein